MDFPERGPERVETKNKNTMPLIVAALLLFSWVFTNVGLTTGQSNIDVSLIILALIFLGYWFKGKKTVPEVLRLSGLREIELKSLLKYSSLLIISTFIIPMVLVRVMGIDLTDLLMNQKSMAQEGLRITKEYSRPFAAVALVIQPVYGTFFEEFIFRGLILRYLMNYNFVLANIVQASIFGFLHLVMSLTLDIPLSYKLYLVIYPTLIGLVLGYGYKKSGQNLFVTWTTHYCVNTITWLTFLFTNKVI